MVEDQIEKSSRLDRSSFEDEVEDSWQPQWQQQLGIGRRNE